MGMFCVVSGFMMFRVVLRVIRIGIESDEFVVM